MTLYDFMYRVIGKEQKLQNLKLRLASLKKSYVLNVKRNSRKYLKNNKRNSGVKV